jgi:hypothetical protein
MAMQQHETASSPRTSPAKTQLRVIGPKVESGPEQGGSVRKAGLAPETLSQSNALMLQRTIGNRAVTRLAAPHLAARAGAIQRYQVQGPWNVNDPVHETITQEALKKAGLLGANEKYTSPKVWEYIRGAIWNDDPEGQLFDANKKRTDDYSSGITWYEKFSDAEKKAAKGKAIGPDDDLIPRSHFGDLQFLHGMGSQDGEAAKMTQGHIMLWAEFTYKVAIGAIAGTTKVGSVPVAGIPELFPKQKDQTVSELFGIAKIGDVRQRASGSLLHIIQDTYSSGHVEREKLDGGKKGRIVSFLSYANQDHDKHGRDDAFQGKGSDVEKLKNVPGAMDAVDKSAQILKFISEKRAWEDVQLYLSMEVLGLVPNPRKSGPGEQYRKPNAPPEPEDSAAGGLPPDLGDYELPRGPGTLA